MKRLAAAALHALASPQAKMPSQLDGASARHTQRAGDRVSDLCD